MIAMIMPSMTARLIKASRRWPGSAGWISWRAPAVRAMVALLTLVYYPSISTCVCEPAQKKERRGRAPAHRWMERSTLTVDRRIVLLDLDLRAFAFKLCLDRVGFFLCNARLDRLRSALDEVLRFLEVEAGHDFAHDLDDVDLLLARGGEDDVELGLRFRDGRCCAAAAGSCDRDRCCRRDAVLLLERFDELVELDDRELVDLIEQFGDS